LPRYLSFTGKGSQYIKMICGGDESELEDFTRLLIKAYTDLPLQNSFKIHLNSNPKEITANGSVLYALAGSEEKQNIRGTFNLHIRDLILKGRLLWLQGWMILLKQRRQVFN
jgi:hypothetical protein